MRKLPDEIDPVSLQSVLFSTDFSAPSMQALPYAVHIARRFGARLYIAHIVPPEDYLAGFSTIHEAARAACVQAELRIKTLPSSPACRGVDCETLVSYGDVWVGLSDFMDQYATDLLVIGTRGRTGVKKFLLGSVAEEVMRDSRCPVLTVGPQISTCEEIDFHNILYATDFSAESTSAATYATVFADTYNARLTLVHAFDGPTESQRSDLQLADVYAREEISHWISLRPDSRAIIEPGPTAEVILRAAADTRSDLIVIGARGAGSVARIASHFGSVAHTVVCQAVCPVLTVRTCPATKKER